MTINEILQSMSNDDKSWLQYLSQTGRHRFHISNAGNLCAHNESWGRHANWKGGHPVAWNTSHLGDRRTRKRAVKVLWDYLASAPSCPPAFVVTMQLPGVIHSVNVNIVLDV